MADTKTSAETRLTALSGGDLVRVSEAQGTSPETYQTKATTAEVMGHQFRGCEIQLNTDDTGVNATSEYAISYDTEISDTDGFWSASPNPDRFTIPSGKGITTIGLSVFMRVSGVTVTDSLSIVVRQYNSGGTNTRFWRHDWYGGANLYQTMSIAAASVSDGDYFRTFIKVSTDPFITIENATNVALVVLGMDPV